MQPPESLKKLDDWRVLVRPPEYQARESTGRAIARRIAPPLFAVTGLLLLLVALLASVGLWRLEWSGVRAQGVVRSFVPLRSGVVANKVYASPVVTYTTSGGKVVTFRDHSASDPPEFRLGQTVTVLYRPARPGGAIIDRGLWNWTGPGALFVLGAGFALFAWLPFRARRGQPRIPVRGG